MKEVEGVRSKETGYKLASETFSILHVQLLKTTLKSMNKAHKIKSKCL